MNCTSLPVKFVLHSQVCMLYESAPLHQNGPTVTAGVSYLGGCCVQLCKKPRTLTNHKIAPCYIFFLTSNVYKSNWIGIKPWV
ncbi:unnamed protein product, partial [Linum tenue]